MTVRTRTDRPAGHVRRLLAAATAAVLVAAGLAVVTAAPAVAADLPSPATALQRDEDVVTSDPLPTVQIDSGYVWAQTTIGNTVYAAGSFSNARAPLASPGTNLTPRSNILAYDITTGALLPFAPSVNGVIKSIAASPDGTRIYIGGSFNSVNGQTRWNIAALDAVTGQLIAGFAPSVGGAGVYGIAATADTVYVAGLLTQANGVARKNFAAFGAAGGTLLPWAPTSDLQADALVLEPGTSRVIAGGRFYLVNDVVQRGLVALDGTTGAIDTGWAAPQTIVNGWNSGQYAGRAGIFALSTDATGVYGTGWVFANASVGNLEGAFAADAGTGAVRWVSDCHGDHYGVYSTGETVYTTSHTHACETLGLWPEQSPRQYRYVEAYTAEAGGILTRTASAGTTYKDWSGTPSPSPYIWYPDFTVGTASGLGQAGLSITGAGDFISIAGEFTTVNNQRYQGIVRFATQPSTGANDGPRLSASTWSAPEARSISPGRVRVVIPANWDRDDRDLTYELLREGTAEPIVTRVLASGWWQQGRPTVILDDKDVEPGSAQTYRVRVSDGDVNTVTSASATVDVAEGEPSLYSDAVLDDGASIYFPLGEVTEDWAGVETQIRGSGVTTTTPGAVEGLSGESASAFTGTSSGRISTRNRIAVGAEYSTELWFRTETTRGGKLLGYGNSQTGTSGSHDRHVYMLNNGRLTFGVYPGTVRTVVTPTAYNDGDWHHVVATQGAEGIKLYVDGELQGENTEATSAQNYSGYWRIGGDSLSGWPSRPSSDYFDGAIDEVAIYPTVLNATQVLAHHAAGLGLDAPTAQFASAATDLAITVDGSASTAPDGRSIVSYAWDFGDGQSASGATASHTFAAAGAYPVTLTVTDSAGLSHAQTQTVTVLAPNVLPSADFSTVTQSLTVTVNGDASADDDGTIDSYTWDWGDGSAPGAGSTASHVYAASGQYTITLTVTDDRGGIASTTQAVSVAHDAPVASFTSAVSGLTVSTDATASTSSDGTTRDYAWSWGDGTPASAGVGASHTYAAAGTYVVELTVTDSLGASHTSSQTVTVSSVQFAARDDFERSVASGWGSSDVGGAWSVLYGAAS
ncbi:MAG: hypothetical protein DI573_02255, partial [Microbacterium sp.]|uniref:PKD domain-containing protein n=1 Tax=Microbacterium sp. TaxID=51671 RepID=UPI000DB559A7